MRASEGDVCAVHGLLGLVHSCESLRRPWSRAQRHKFSISLLGGWPERGCAAIDSALG